MEKEILTIRKFAHPPELVFKAWSDPDHLKNWFGPKGFTNTFYEFDFCAGGKWRFDMHGPDGKNYPNESHFVEIIPNQKIVFDHVVLPHFRAVITFEDEGGKTKVTFRQIFNDSETCHKVSRYAIPANEENMDKLGVQLERMAVKK